MRGSPNMGSPLITSPAATRRSRVLRSRSTSAGVPWIISSLVLSGPSPDTSTARTSARSTGGRSCGRDGDCAKAMLAASAAAMAAKAAETALGTDALAEDTGIAGSIAPSRESTGGGDRRELDVRRWGACRRRERYRDAVSDTVGTWQL